MEGGSIMGGWEGEERRGEVRRGSVHTILVWEGWCERKRREGAILVLISCSR